MMKKPPLAVMNKTMMKLPISSTSILVYEDFKIYSFYLSNPI